GGAAGSSGRGRGTDVLSVTAVFTGARAPLNMGAGCEPDCRNSTLIRIASVTKTPSTTPTASRGLHPRARQRYVARPCSVGALFTRTARAMAYGLSFIGMLAGSSLAQGARLRATLARSLAPTDARACRCDLGSDPRSRARPMTWTRSPYCLSGIVSDAA